MQTPTDSAPPTSRRPGRPRGSVAANREVTRDRILDAATELFAAQGFHGTSVAEISARADIKTGALYHHIKSKEELLWEILRGWQRARDDDSLDVVGRLLTTRTRKEETTASVPLLFNYERGKDGARTLRLLQFLPIPLGGATTATAEPAR